MSTERPRKPRPGRKAPWARHLADAFRHRGFVVCLVLLGTFAIGFEVLAVRKGIQFRKLPVNLKKPLKELEQDRLAPYRLVRPVTLQPDMADELGTEEYVQWVIADPTGPDGRNSGRQINLLVTYYTGQPDPVPHVPEVCYAGGGHRLVAQNFDTVTITGPGGDERIPIQVLEFERHGLLGPSRRTVIYTMHANGRFHPDRQAVRLAVYDPRSKYAYFTKLEIGMDIGRGYASGQQATEAGKRFLQVVIPVLLEDHWPNWGAVFGKPEPQADPGGAPGIEAADG